MGEAVDGDPVAGIPGGSADELPGPLGVVDDQALEEAEGEPASLELRLAQEAIGDEQPARRPLASGRLAEAALDRLDQGPANTVEVADPRCDAALAGEVLGVAKRREAGPEDVGEAVRIADLVGQAAAEVRGVRPAVGDELDRSGRDRARGRRHHARASSWRSAAAAVVPAAAGASRNR